MKVSLASFLAIRHSELLVAAFKLFLIAFLDALNSFTQNLNLESGAQKALHRFD